jgi:hypothetical protein
MCYHQRNEQKKEEERRDAEKYPTFLQVRKGKERERERD